MFEYYVVLFIDTLFYEILQTDTLYSNSPVSPVRMVGTTISTDLYVPFIFSDLFE